MELAENRLNRVKKMLEIGCPPDEALREEIGGLRMAQEIIKTPSVGKKIQAESKCLLPQYRESISHILDLHPQAKEGLSATTAQLVGDFLNSTG